MYIAYFSSILAYCIFSLNILRQERAITLCCLSSSLYSNDLTLLSLLGNDDDASQVCLAQMRRPPTKLSGCVGMIILHASPWGVNISAEGNEQSRTVAERLNCYCLTRGDIALLNWTHGISLLFLLQRNSPHSPPWLACALKQKDRHSLSFTYSY